jgi:branched-chain amino acid transport system substrate-binding protein
MASKLNRRTFLAGTALAATGVATSELARPAIAQGAPFKIGLLTVKTGPLAQGGNQMEQGIVSLLKEKNYTFAGRKVDLIIADTGGKPDGTRTKVQEVIERDKVDVILGPLAAFELLAIVDYVKQHGTPLLSLAAAEDVTQRNANPWIVRPSATSAQCCHAMADYGAKELKYKTAVTISEDFAFGYEQMSGFQRVFEDAGGKVQKKLWPPLVTPDYTPYIAQIGSPDCVFNGFAGSNPLKFLKTYSDLGLKDKVPLLAGWTAMDDALNKSLGDEAVGVYSAHWYSADLDTPSNKKLIETMVKDYGNIPGGYSAGMYVAGQFVEAALQKTGGKSDDKTAFMDAIKSAKLTDTPRGAIGFDHLGNAVGNVYIRKAEKKDGKIVNTAIKTYANVSQFWTYDEKWFLAQPVYSRDYPPLKN